MGLLLCATQLVFAQAVRKCDDTAVTHREFVERGIACFNAGLYPAAVEDFSRALQLQPDDIAILAWRAHVYHDGLRAFDLATADYSLILQLDPTNALAYHNRGLSYEQLGNHTQAIADYNRALQLDPSYGQAYGNRGLLYLTLGEKDLALADMTQAISLGYEPLDWLYQKRGQVYFEMGQYESALNDFAAAINLVPQSGYYYNWRAYTYRRLDQYEAALADFNRAIELNGRDSLAYGERGWIWTQLGDPAQAMRDYNLALEADPNNRDALVYRGNAYLQANAYDLALADYKRAAKVDPNYPAAYLGLGNVYYATGDHSRALDHYRHYLALTGDKADAAIAQRVSDMERPPVWMGALYLAMIVGVVLGFRLLRKSIRALIDNLSPRPTHQTEPEWLRALSSEADSGD
jgi:tetratricopeptide (TPR) repeat protein